MSLNIVSWGGGTNSTAMIIALYRQNVPIDIILFADTGGEQPYTYEYMSTPPFKALAANEWRKL